MKNSGWKNKNGTSDRSCSCGSWKNHWINNSGKNWPKTCSIEYCYEDAVVGAHIINSSEEGEWIVPACKACNKRTDVFSLKNNIVLITANTNKTNC